MFIMHRTVFWFLLVIVMHAAPAHSGSSSCPDCQSLNQKFGPTWSCKMISAELDPLYQSCRACEEKNLEFVQLSQDRGECGAPKGSLRGKLDEMLGKEPTVAPDIAAEQERQRRIDAETNAKEATIQKKMREDRMRRSRESDVSGPGSGASRAPTDQNASRMNELLGEMSGMEARQKQLKDGLNANEIARREEAFRQQELRETDAETRAYEESQRRAREEQSEFGPNVAVFKISNSYKYLVHIRFYSQDRSHEWPGDRKVWIMDDSKSHTFRLACRTGERICFGAWAPPRANPYWGVGSSNNESCQGCCIACGGSSAFATNLVYNGPEPQTAGGDSSGGGGSNSAAEVIGAAAGIAAFAAGLAAGGAGGGGGGGSPSYRAAPNYQHGPAMRNRESGVSGGR
jgi:hypothetical protein